MGVSGAVSQRHGRDRAPEQRLVAVDGVRRRLHELGRLLADDLEQAFLERMAQPEMSSALAISSKASIPVSSALSSTSSSESRTVLMPDATRVIGKAPKPSTTASARFLRRRAHALIG